MILPTNYVTKKEKIFKKPNVKDNIVLSDCKPLLKGDLLLDPLPSTISDMGVFVLIERQTVKCRDCGTCASTFVRTRSNWVCTSCGLVHTNLVDAGPERILDEEGCVDMSRQRFGTGDTVVPEGFKGLLQSSYKTKHKRLIFKQITDLVSGMRMPEVINTYANKLFETYVTLLREERMIHSPWSVTAACVYAAILIHENVIHQPFSRTRDEVCKVAERFRLASTFLNRTNAKNRSVTLKRVDRYVHLFQQYGLIPAEITIPPLRILSDVRKKKHVHDQCRRWAIFNQCQTHKSYLPSNKPWGIDIEIKQGILTVVDIDTTSIAWDAGIRINDMIIRIHQTNTSNNNQTIEDIFQTVSKLKQQLQSIKIIYKRTTNNA